jgi:hypothetical protein
MKRLDIETLALITLLATTAALVVLLLGVALVVTSWRG